MRGLIFQQTDCLAHAHVQRVILNRYNRISHPTVRYLIEDVLQISTSCYTDPLNLNPEACESASRTIFTSRGKVFGFQPNGTDSESAFENYTKAIPYNIDPKYQWNATSSQTSPRSIFSLFIGPKTVIPELQLYPQLLEEANYTRAMLLADDIIVSLRNGTYKGVSYRDITLWQIAVAEGFTPEELRLFIDRSGTGAGSFLHSNVERLLQGVLRSAALRKAEVSGLAGLFVPVQLRDGKIRRIGMITIIERMLAQITSKGVRVFYDSKVTGIDRVWRYSKLVRLSFVNGESVKVRKVVLNIGKPDLVALGLNSEPLKSSSELFRRAVERIVSYPYAKTYCFWEDAWWITKLNKSVGIVRTADQSIFTARYHDGDYVCELREGDGRRKCRGAILTSYIGGDTTGGGPAITVRTTNDKPYTPLTNSDSIRIIVAGNMSAHEQLYFDEVHKQLRRAHGSTFKSFGLDVQTDLSNASGCVVGDWSEVGIHVEHGSGRGEENVFDLYTRPVADLDISLVNEAWAEVYGWAESSLRSAERALFHAFGVGRPSWMDDVFHRSVVEKFNLG